VPDPTNLQSTLTFHPPTPTDKHTFRNLLPRIPDNSNTQCRGDRRASETKRGTGIGLEEKKKKKSLRDRV
jgi:hypothetical protein